MANFFSRRPHWLRPLKTISLSATDCQLQRPSIINKLCPSFFFLPGFSKLVQGVDIETLLAVKGRNHSAKDSVQYLLQGEDTQPSVCVCVLLQLVDKAYVDDAENNHICYSNIPLRKDTVLTMEINM